MELFDLGIDDEKKTPDTQIILRETIIDKSQQHDTKLKLVWNNNSLCHILLERSFILNYQTLTHEM